MVGVDGHEVVAMDHGCERPEQRGRWDRINRFHYVTNYPPNRSLRFVSLPKPFAIIKHNGPEPSKRSFLDAKKAPGLMSMAGRKLVVDRGSAADDDLRQNVRRKF